MIHYSKLILKISVFFSIVTCFTINASAVFAFSSQNFVMDDVSFGDTLILSSAVKKAPVIIAGPSIIQKGLTIEISWVTDKPANSIVSFGQDATYGTQIGQFSEIVNDHKVILKNLSPETTYHYQVSSFDDLKNSVLSDDKTFATGSRPAISSVEISNITLNSAIVSWTTNTITSSRVNYGKTLDYDLVIDDKSSGLTTIHTVRLTNLEIGTIYHVQVQGHEDDGNSIFSDDYSFVTLENPTVSDLKISSLTEKLAQVTWTTNVETDSFVEFKPVAQDVNISNTKKTLGHADAVLNHVVTLEPLTEKTNYEYNVVGKDKYGNLVTSAIGKFITPDDVTAPEISKIRSEAKVTSEGEGIDTQVVVAWTTSEPATSQIEYSEGVGKQTFDLQSDFDSELVFNHIVVMTKLKTAAAYTFHAKSKDATGNETISQKFVILMPQRRAGVMEVIFGTLSEAFGWFRNVGPYLFDVVLFKT